MEIDKSRIYTAVNADELHEGDKVIIADSIEWLLEKIRQNDVAVLSSVKKDFCSNRFRCVGAGTAWRDLAYLVERKKEPKYIPWTKENCPLGLGDKVIMKVTECEFLITGCDKNSENFNINNDWFSYEELFEHFMKLDGSPCGMLIE